MLVGPAGIFTVETTTRSKPERGDARVIFDGERITVFGREPDRDPARRTAGRAHARAVATARLPRGASLGSGNRLCARQRRRAPLQRRPRPRTPADVTFPYCLILSA